MVRNVATMVIAAAFIPCIEKNIDNKSQQKARNDYVKSVSSIRQFNEKINV